MSDFERAYQIANFKATITQAGHLQSFSAILAGLVFTAITILLTNPPKTVEATPSSPGVLQYYNCAAPLLICCLFSLIVSTFLFTLITSFPVLSNKHYEYFIELYNKQRICFAISSVVIAVSVITMFLSLCFIFFAYDLNKNAKLFSLLLYYFVIIISLFNVFYTIINGFNRLYGINTYIYRTNLNNVTGIILSLLAIPSIFVCIFKFFRKSEKFYIYNSQNYIMILIIFLSIIVIFYAIYFFIFLDYLNRINRYYYLTGQQ